MNWMGANERVVNLSYKERREVTFWSRLMKGNLGSTTCGCWYVINILITDEQYILVVLPDENTVLVHSFAKGNTFYVGPAEYSGTCGQKHHRPLRLTDGAKAKCAHHAILDCKSWCTTINSTTSKQSQCSESIRWRIRHGWLTQASEPIM
jgi:hypothetical protein